MMLPLCLSASGGGVSSDSQAPRRLLPNSEANGGLAGRPVMGEPGAQVHPPTSPTTFPRYLVPLPGEAPPAAVRGPAERLILLTFDDGPDLQGTPLILD